MALANLEITIRSGAATVLNSGMLGPRGTESVAQRKVNLPEASSDALAPVREGAQRGLLKQFVTELLRPKAQSLANVDERKRPAPVLGNNPAMRIEIEPLLSRYPGGAIVSQSRRAWSRIPAASFCLAWVMRGFLVAFMFGIGWFHLYLRNAGRRISENFRFFSGQPFRRGHLKSSRAERSAVEGSRRTTYDGVRRPATLRSG